MKLFIYICVFVFVIGPCVRAKSFNFGNFFLGSSKKELDSPPNIPPASSQNNHLFDSEPVMDYSSENESEAFNSSSDDIFDFDDYQNSSSDSLEVSRRNEAADSSVPDADPDNTTDPVAVKAAVAEVQDNETLPSDKNETSTSVSSTVASEKTTTVAEVQPTANVSTPSSTVESEQEEVVLGTTTGATAVLITKTFFQKSIDWVEDAYTLSILIPITAGILFATTIIVVIALCRCVRRCCRRRRFKRKPLPDSVKSLRPSDRARLLGDTSDEEF